MANVNTAKLTAAQKAEVKQAKQKALTATKLDAINQQRAATQALVFAQNRAGSVLDIGQAAAAGGKFIDTSAAAGYQSPVTTQMTGYLMGTVKDPFAAARQAAIKNRKRVTSKPFKKQFGQAVTADAISAIKDSRASGGSASASATSAVPTIPAGPVRF